MSFQKTKRKGLKAGNTEVIGTSNVVPIDIDKMELKFGKLTARFRRLKYMGCPQIYLTRIGYDFGEKNLIDMKRDPLIFKLYEAFKGYPSHSETGYGYFAFLTRFVTFFDNKSLDVSFSEERVFEFYEDRQSQVLTGKLNKNSLQKERSQLIAILKELGNAPLARKIPKVKNRRSAAIPTEALPDSDYLIISKKLMSAFTVHAQCVFKGSPPVKCPLFDVEKGLINGLSQKDIKYGTGPCRVETGPYWQNRVTEIALMITALWTGGNLSPLLSLRRSDAQKFKKCDGDTYEFDSVKARALYERQGLGIGFTKRSREFIESWLLVSEQIDPRSNAMLFPYLNINGQVTDDSKGFSNPHKFINIKLAAMGLPTITTRILRTTRSSVVMRAFDDIFITAWANRNSLGVTNDHYLEGVKEVHDFQLASAFEVQKSMADGSDKKKAIEEYSVKFQDPFTQDEWENKKKTALANKTPTGVRCTSPFGAEAVKSLRPLRALKSSDEGACIDFLKCFECPQHALIAEVDDIWLMLSFRDTVKESLSRPSLNSSPSEDFHKVGMMVDVILQKMQEKSPSNFADASHKNADSSHPLYDDKDSISDLLEVYKK